MTITKDLGAVSAYAYAKEKGYTGTEAEYAELMASYGTVAQEAAESAAEASAAAEAAQQAGTSAGGSATAASSAQAAAQSAANLATQSAASAQADATAAAQSAASAAESQQTTQQTAQDFEETAQQAVSDVNTAGTNQKELARRQAQNSEAWAVGQRDGDDVGVSDPTYHNNSKWYAQQAGTSEQSAGQSATGAASSAQAAAQSAAEAAESARTLQTDESLTKPGQAADAKVVGDEIGELKSAFSNLDERNFSDFAPIVGNLKNELLSYVNGGIPEQYIGANIAYTDEKYYLVSDFSNVTVPSGLRVVLAFYSDTDPTYFVTGLEKTADFSLSEFRYKYFRYCIRKVGSGTITNAEAKAVTLLMFNRYYADAVKAQGTAESYNDFLTTGVGFLANTLKVGRITSTGIIEGSRAGRYFDAYIPTKSIHSIEVPDGYAVNIYYYNANKVYAAASTSFVDFAPNTSYMYCRVNLVKYNSAHDQMLEFNDDVSAFADFKVNIVKGNMTDFGDLLPNLASALTSNGITYTFENGKYYIKGTASAFSYAFLFNNENALPYGIVPGKRYFFEFEGLPSRINATIYHATSGGWVNAEAQRLIPTYYYGGYFDVPSDAVGLRISLSVNSGFTVDHVTEAHIYSVDSLAYAERVKQKATSPMLSIVYDDGLTKFKDYILPIIEAKKVPIATSIIVSAVEADNPNVMTYADIKECYEKGAEVLVHSKERTEEEWGTSVSDVAYELRTAKHLLNSKVAHVPNCYIYAAQSGSYPVCRYAVQSEFMSAFNSGSQGSVSANNGVTNYRGAIDPYNIKRRWADANWLSGETDAETILKGWIDELVANGNGWQVWTRHNYGNAVEPTYATTLSNVIDYALSKGVRIVTVERGLAEYVY